ncbi:hypothetical protein D187_008378 [Cystobacter fuscus DSM 2262]|uniref:Uncharacterized protein n=1 Tax=Cystobacter fuscus (strain ATCC 25194 / DSM 2262 / NBRC 100088 / M29) TaxID=1242864 RepID=S9P0K9_CYSF2|nr:hypothetical protein D187_008378 [Cystobacter fuscus DSM 2262]
MGGRALTYAPARKKCRPARPSERLAWTPAHAAFSGHTVRVLRTPVRERAP